MMYSYTRSALALAAALAVWLAGPPQVHAQQDDEPAQTQPDEPAEEDEDAPGEEKTAEQETDKQDPSTSDSSVAAPPLPESFDALTRLGSKRYRQKDYAGALEAFEKAHELEAEPDLLYNIGRLSELTGDFPRAIEAYERYLETPGLSTQARRDTLDRLDPLLETEELRRRRKRAKAEDSPAPTVQDQQQADSAAEPKAPDASGPDALTYWLMGGGGTAMVAGGVMGYLAYSASHDLEHAATLHEAEHAAESGQLYSILSDGLIIAGAGVATVGLIRWLTWEDEPARAERDDVQLTPYATGDATSVRIGISLEY